MGIQAEHIVAAAQAARSAPRGQKQAVYSEWASVLNISTQTLMRKIKDVAYQAPRKQRADAGKTALTEEEARLISATVVETIRQNGKKGMTADTAVEILRANNAIIAARLDPETGEQVPLSTSAVLRALRVYGVHPDQMTSPAAATRLQSLHPNHVWQLDATQCVLYYLPREGGQALRVMAESEFNKNKPANFKKVEQDRIWHYTLTDHTSGWIYAEYVRGGESAINLLTVLINAMQERPTTGDVLHGVPQLLMMDPGSANISATVQNMCRALGIEMIVNKVGNARAKGQVEKANDIWERAFESALRYSEVTTVAQLNDLAMRFRAWFNASKTHTRHGKARTSVWMQIRADQLIKAPAPQVCRELATTAPVERTLSGYMTVQWSGNEYSAERVAGLNVGQKILVTRNPWREDCIQAVLIGEDGHEVFHVLPMVEKNEFGFAADAPVIGRSHRALADTPAETNRKAHELLVTGTETQEAATTARKSKSRPLADIDPFKHVEETTLPAYLPRRGTQHTLQAPRVELQPFTHVEAARLLKAKVPGWNKGHFAWLQEWYADGVPHDALDQIAGQLNPQSLHKSA